jgi:hypothetical protein
MSIPDDTAGKPVSGLAIAGFITAFFCGIVGLVLSIRARRDIDAYNESLGGRGGRGFTTAGIAISIVNILFEMAYVVASIALPDTY